MRSSVVAIIAVLLSLTLLSGCGSSGDTATAAPPATGQPAAGQPAAAGTPAAQPGAAVPPGQQPAGQVATAPTAEPKPEVPRKFEINGETPLFFTQALKQKKPILIVYYNSDEAVSKLVVAEANAAYKHYEKTATLLLLESTKNEDIASLARQLQVDFIPYVAAIDRSGNIVFERTGYQDSKVMELALYKASTK